MHDDRTCGSSASVPSAYPAQINHLASRSGRTGAEHRPFRSGPADWPLSAAAGIITASRHRAAGRESPALRHFFRLHVTIRRPPAAWADVLLNGDFRPYSRQMHRFGRALCTLKLPGTQKPYAEQLPGPMWSGQGDDHQISGGAGGSGLARTRMSLAAAWACGNTGRVAGRRLAAAASCGRHPPPYAGGGHREGG